MHTVCNRGGGGEGVYKLGKNAYVITGRPLIYTNTLVPKSKDLMFALASYWHRIGFMLA